MCTCTRASLPPIPAQVPHNSATRGHEEVQGGRTCNITQTGPLRTYPGQGHQQPPPNTHCTHKHLTGMHQAIASENDMLAPEDAPVQKINFRPNTSVFVLSFTFDSTPKAVLCVLQFIWFGRGGWNMAVNSCC